MFTVQSNIKAWQDQGNSLLHTWENKICLVSHITVNETNFDHWVNCANKLSPLQFIYLDLLHVFGWLPSVAAAPQCSDWPQDPAAAGPLRQWSRKPDTQELSNPHVPPTKYVTSGHRRRWCVLCHSPDTPRVGVAEERYEGVAGYYGCCCGNAFLPGSGCPLGSDCDYVLEEAGFCPCLWWGSRKEGSPGHLLPRCRGHYLGHSWGGRQKIKLNKRKAAWRRECT